MKRRAISWIIVCVLCLSLLPVTALAAGRMAYASTQSVEVDGAPVEFQMYALKDANGNDTNYVKVRDVAFALKDTAARFSVSWDGSVCLTPGADYVPDGSEMQTPFSGDRAYSRADAVTKVNGQAVDLAALVLTDDNGGGYTYYKLRDLGAALGFTVDWSAERGVYVETPAATPATPTDDPIALTSQTFVLASGSVSAHVITVDLSDPRVTVKAALPGGMLDRTADFAAQAQASGADVVVNGNFFNVSAAVKDPVGHVMIDGKMVYGNSGRSTLAITDQHRAIMGRPGLFYRVESPDGSLWWDAFEVNVLQQFAGQAVLYTPARGASVSISYPGYVLQVENDAITDYRPVQKGGSEAIPANGYLVYFSAEVASTDWHMTPVMGQQVRVRPYVSSDNGEPFSMDGVTAMVNGAPRLVRNGAIETYEEPEVSGIRKNSATNRTAVGLCDDGATLVLAVSPAATVQQMRELMLRLGCVEAMNLDGGASSALYYRGQTITAPGRALATTLQVFVAK